MTSDEAKVYLATETGYDPPGIECRMTTKGYMLRTDNTKNWFSNTRLVLSQQEIDHQRKRIGEAPRHHREAHITSVIVETREVGEWVVAS